VVLIYIGVDVSATFTDVILSDESICGGPRQPSPWGDLDRRVLDACRLDTEATLESMFLNVARFGLDTIPITNAISAHGRAIASRPHLRGECIHRLRAIRAAGVTADHQFRCSSNTGLSP
jgi:hypothetical protein